MAPPAPPARSGRAGQPSAGLRGPPGRGLARHRHLCRPPAAGGDADRAGIGSRSRDRVRRRGRVVTAGGRRVSAEVKVPRLAESISEATLVEWLKPDGAPVKADEPIATLETDKAAVEIVADVAGTLAQMKKAGDVVKVGDVLARIADGAGAANATAPAPAAPASKPAARAPAPAPAAPAPKP